MPTDNSACAGIESDQDDDYFEPKDDCQRCGGTGRMIVCIDDMCQGSGECIHGDGVEKCEDCKGTGEA